MIGNEFIEITISRTNNGWLLVPAMMGRRSGEVVLVNSAVAETPERLADLVVDWARRQVAEKAP